MSSAPRVLLDLQKRSLELQKGAVDNGFHVFARLEDQTREIALRWLEQIPYIPQELRGVGDAWWHAHLNSRQTWKSAIDRTFQLADELCERLGEE